MIFDRHIIIPAPLRSWYVAWRAVVTFCLIALICLMAHDWWEGMPPGDISRLGGILLMVALLVDCFLSVVDVVIASEEIKSRVIDLIEEADIQVVSINTSIDSMAEHWEVQLQRNRWAIPQEEVRPWEQS